MSTRTAVLAATAVAVVAGVGMAVASIPSSSGTIYGCYDPGGGAPHSLSIVDDPTDCNTTLLPFNQTGPAGAPGAPGAPGSPGPRGTIAGSHRVTGAATQANPSNGDVYTGSAGCPAGEVLLGGGFDGDRSAGTFSVITSRPNAEATRWEVTLKQTFPFGGTTAFSSAFANALNAWREAQEQARHAIAAQGLPAIANSFSPRGAGGSRVTTKESAKVQRALRKAIAKGRVAQRASTVLEASIKSLLNPPKPPVETLTDSVYALCGA